MDDEVFEELESEESDRVISTDPVVVTTYTRHARQVLHDAESLAATAPGGAMTGEHLLLSLAANDRCAAAQVLAGCGLHSAVIARTIAFVQGAPVPSDGAETVVLSPRMERVLTNAGREAAHQKRDEVDTLHLLIALMRERQGIAALALEAPAVGHELLGAALSQAMRNGMTDPS